MATGTSLPAAAEKMTTRQWVQLVLVYLFIPLILLLCSGNFFWWQAWVFSALIFIAGIVGRAWAEHRHPGLLAERVNLDRLTQAKAWDKILSPLMGFAILFPLIIVAGLDHRIGWSAYFAPWVNIFGLMLVALGYALAAWALVENRYFSSVVRIQVDRGHMVCDSGPYRFIRHPGYAGNLLPLTGIVLGLGSTWAILPAVLALIITITRTALEDRTLQEELPGYQEYCRRVRYRLFPGIY